MPVTGAPSRGLPLTAGSLEVSSSASFFSEAGEIPDLLRQVAQLAGFVDQARLFRALRAVTNKLHFLTPFGVSFRIMGLPAPLHGTARGEIQHPKDRSSALLLSSSWGAAS